MDGRRRQAELKTIVEGIMADANHRSGFQSGDLSAGHDGKNFFLARQQLPHEHRRPVPVPLHQQQQRRPHRQRPKPRRLRVPPRQAQVQRAHRRPKIGYAFTPRQQPKLRQHRPGRRRAELPFDNGWKLKAGKLKLPFLFEELVSSSRQLALDRSLSTEFFTLNYGEQLQLEIPFEDSAKIFLAYSDGANTGSSAATSDTADYAFTARVQTRLAGDWETSQRPHRF